MRLGNRFKKNGIDLTSASVVFIKHKYAPHFSIKPQVTRTSDIKTRWTFHAILVLENIVYDLDFSMSPTPIKLKDYLEQMWIVDDLNDYVFQVKPFSKYNSHDFGGRFNRNEYPEISLEEFISNF